MASDSSLSSARDIRPRRRSVKRVPVSSEESEHSSSSHDNSSPKKRTSRRPRRVYTKHDKKSPKKIRDEQEVHDSSSNKSDGSGQESVGITPTKGGRKGRRKNVTNQFRKFKNSDEATHRIPRIHKKKHANHSEIFEAIRLSPTDTLNAAKDWVSSFSNDEDPSKNQIILFNLMLEAAGLPLQFYEWPDIQGKPVADILAETLATMDRRGLDPGEKIPVNSREGKYKAFVSNYKLFASTIVQRCCSESIDVTTRLLEILENFYKDATLSKARFLRHSSVLLLYGVCDGICASYSSTKKLHEKFTQQLAAEKKRKENSVTEINKNIRSSEEMINILEKQLRKIVGSTQRLRHKDVSPEIRLHTCEALVSWARTLPEIFLEDDSHKRYLAWSTTDAHEAVRICSLSFILECLQDHNYKRTFLMNGSPCVQIMIQRLVFAAKDPNATVRAVSVDCCFEIVEEIEDQYFEELLDCIWRNEDPAVAAKLGMLVDKAVFSNPIARPFPTQDAFIHAKDKSASDVLAPQIIDGQNDTKDMLDINSLLEYVMEFAKEQMRDMEKLVQCFWEIAPALRNVPLMIKALLGENVFLADGVTGPLQESHRLPLLFILLSVISILSEDLTRLRAEAKKNKDNGNELARLEHVAFTSVNLLFRNLKDLLQKTKVREQELQVMCQIVADASSLSTIGAQLPSSECLHILSSLFQERVDAATLEFCAAAIGSLTDVSATADVRESFLGLFYSDVSLLKPMLAQIANIDPAAAERTRFAGLQSVALCMRRLVLLAKYSSYTIFSKDLENFVELLLEAWKSIHNIKNPNESSVVILQIEREIVTLVHLIYSHLWSNICEEIDLTSWDNDRLAAGEETESQHGVLVRGARKRIRNSPPSKARKRVRRKDIISDEANYHDKEAEESHTDEPQYNISSEGSLQKILVLVCVAERIRDVLISFLQKVLAGYKDQNCWLNLNALEASFEIANLNKLPVWFSGGGKVEDEEEDLSTACRLRDKFIYLGDFPYSTRHVDIMANCVHHMLSDSELIDTGIVLPQGILHGVNIDYFRCLSLKDVRLESPFDTIRGLGPDTKLTNDIALRLSCAKLAADLVIESNEPRIWTSKCGGAVLARLNVSTRPELAPAAKVFLQKIKAFSEENQSKVLWSAVVAALRYLTAPADYKLFLASMWKIVKRNFVRRDIESYVQFVLVVLELPLKRETSIELIKIFASSAGRGQGGSVMPIVDQESICRFIVEQYLSANDRELYQIGKSFASSFLSQMAISNVPELLEPAPGKAGRNPTLQSDEESDESSICD